MNRRTFTKTLSAGIGLSLLPYADLMAAAPAAAIHRPKFPRRLNRPKRLQKGDTIALVCPASAITEEQLQKSVTNLEGLGFKVIYSNNILARNGYLAGTDQQRADDLNRFFADPQVSGIWCVRGGYGCARMLHLLDYKSIKKNPKVLVGYSDVTALHQALVRYGKLICYHGPVASSSFQEYAVSQMQAVLMQSQERLVIPYATQNEAAAAEDSTYKRYVIRSGVAEGRLVGGNLSLLTSLIGTPYELDLKKTIVFLEDIGEKPYRLDRMLTQLLLHGRLHKAAGIVLGVFRACESKNPDKSLSLSATLKDRLYSLGIPVLYGWSLGHIAHNCTLPIGVKARLDANAQTLTLVERGVDM